MAIVNAVKLAQAFNLTESSNGLIERAQRFVPNSTASPKRASD